MTEQLIRKDVRLLRPVLSTAAGLGLLFYVVIPVLLLVDWRRSELKRIEELTGVPSPFFRTVQPASYFIEKGAEMVLGVSVVMWLVNLLLAVTVAGMAFSVERRERWAELTAMLPVSRSQVVLAKALASCGVIAGLLGVNAVVAISATTLAGHWDLTFVNYSQNDWSGLREGIWYYVAAVAGMCGVAWLLSSLLRSAVIATVTGIGLGLSVWCLLMLLGSQRGAAPSQTVVLQHVAAWLVFVVGAACFFAGTLVQLRRQSP